VNEIKKPMSVDGLDDATNAIALSLLSCLMSVNPDLAGFVKRARPRLDVFRKLVED
jgi:hypothetical protein